MSLNSPSVISDLWTWGFFKRKPQDCLDGDDADTAAEAEEVEWEEKEEARRGHEEEGRKMGKRQVVPAQLLPVILRNWFWPCLVVPSWKIGNMMYWWQRSYLPTAQYKAAAAAAKSLQSCPTLCDPIDSSPRDCPIPGILQARTLEWVVISFSNAWKWKVKVKSLSHARLFTTPWTAAYQAPPSMGFSRQEYGSGVPSPSPIQSSRQTQLKKDKILKKEKIRRENLTLWSFKTHCWLPGFFLPKIRKLNTDTWLLSNPQPIIKFC